MVLVGTAGFSYRDWKGVFYPEGIKDGEMLGFYAGLFPCVELDFTYYQMPSVRTMEGLARKVPGGFEFCVKAYKGMTHELKGAEGGPDGGEGNDSVFRAFAEAIKPMTSRGSLGCVLAQFPWGFKRTQENVDYVRRLKGRLKDASVVVEFRNREWVRPDTFELLRSEGLGFCCVDEPRLRGLVPPVAEVTSDTAYVRFHGRNAEKWWKHDQAWERYNYLYSEAELAEWVPKIKALDARAAKTYVLFNNCHAGQAAENARMLQSMMKLGFNGLGGEDG
ncbi:MAG: DUF72 domain-containing protein [Clostridia bacterium]